MAPTLEKRIETRCRGKFTALVPKFESLSLISQIQTDRLEDAKSRELCFYCGDGVTYGLRGQEVFLYLTDFANNPLTEDPEKASQELIRTHNFFVDISTASDLEAKASASNVVAFNLSELPIQKENDELGYVEVSTSKLAEGKDAFRAQYGDKVAALFDRVHGDAIYGLNGIGDILRKKEGTRTTRIFMLNQEYVQKVLESREEGTMIARAAILVGFDSMLDFRSDARFVIWNVDFNGYARGVLKQVAEGDEQKIMPYEDALREADLIAPEGTPFNPIMIEFVNKLYNWR